MADPSKQSTVNAPALQNLFPSLWRYALVLTGRTDWAGELARETVQQSQTQTETLEALYQRAQSCWFDHMRAAKLGDEGRAPPSMANSGEHLAALAPALDGFSRLSDRRRQAFFLIYIEGYSYRDAARLTGVSVSEIASLLATARTQINSMAGPS